jgi:hypothetical protein
MITEKKSPSTHFKLENTGLSSFYSIAFEQSRQPVPE